MITRLYSVYDSKSEIFMAPFVQPTDAVAVRDIITAAQDEKTKIARWPQDLELFYLGEYNDTTGRVSGLKAPESLGIVKDIVVRGGARRLPVPVELPLEKK